MDKPWRDTGDGACARLYEDLSREQAAQLLQDAKTYSWRYVDLDNCGLSELPEESALWDLPELKRLDLGSDPFRSSKHGRANSFTRLPQAITRLKGLEYLSLTNTQISALPPGFSKLSRLQSLHLSGTQISALPPDFAELTQLHSLYLSDSRLSALPPGFAGLSKLRKLSLHHTPLAERLPPEILRQGAQDQIRYILDMQTETVAKEHFNEAKLVIVGQPGVGKTSLLERLVHDRYDGTRSTEGIDIRTWDFSREGEDYRLNVWDFGGQEIYHATHQFFLSRRTLYLLVWDAVQEDEYGRLEYWLQTIRSLAGDSPIFLVMNKCDKDLGRCRRVEQELLDRYGIGREPYYVSCRDDVGISALREDIQAFTPRLELVQTSWKASWLALRRQLEEKKPETPHISFDAYLDYSLAEGLDRQEAESALQFFHDLGLVLWFRGEPLLQDLVILDPEWGTDAVYKVLDQQERVLKGRNGVLRYDDLPRIWTDEQRYPKSLYPHLLGLMRKFDLAFTLEENRRYLVAELLGVDPVRPAWPEDGKDSISLRYAYGFLPAGIMTRLIVRLHDYLETDEAGVRQCWRKGAYFARDGARARVELHDSISEKAVVLQIHGRSVRERRALMTLIRENLREIHKRFHALALRELVPCKCREGCPGQFDLAEVLQAEALGERLQCRAGTPWSMVEPQLLLDGIEPLPPTEEEERRASPEYIHIVNNIINEAAAAPGAREQGGKNPQKKSLGERFKLILENTKLLLWLIAAITIIVLILLGVLDIDFLKNLL